MTKKHFEKAAKLCRDTSDENRLLMVETFVTFFQSFNNRFDSEQFRAACEPK